MSDGNYAFRLILLAVIIAANGFFAGAEVALLSSRKSRLRQLSEAGNLGAQAALSLLANPERLLSVVQVGVTLASLGLGWAGEETIFHLVSALFAPVLTPASEGWIRGISFTLSFAIMSYAHVVLGEVVPKNLAIEKADRLAMVVSPVLLVFYRVSEPFVFAIEKSAALLSRLIGLKGQQHGGGHSAEELRYILGTSGEEGPLRTFERTAMQRLLDLQDYTAREIMVPRHAIVSVSVDATLDQVLRTFIEHLYSRLPVYDRKPENIIGLVHFKDLIVVWEARKLASERRRPVRPFRLRTLMHKAVVVPETKPLNQILDEMRERHTHMMMVVDEFGTITGLLTMEDVLEQVFGEIEDEHDEKRARPVETDLLEVDGTTSIRDLATQYAIELPGEAGFETLAGFLLTQFRDFPKLNDSLSYGGRRFTVVEMDRNRIARVRVEKTPAVVV